MQVVSLKKIRNKEILNSFDYNYKLETVNYQVLTRKYRAYPVKDQQEIFNLWFKRCDLLWNKILKKFKIKKSKGVDKNDISKYVTKLKHQDKKFSWLQEIPDDILKFTVVDRFVEAVDAYKDGLRKRPKEKKPENHNLTHSVTFPLRKGCHNIYPYTVLFPTAFKTPKDQVVGKVRYKKHCGLNGQPKEITLTRESDGKWYVCIAVRVPVTNTVYNRENSKPRQILGNDMNVKRLVQSSDDTYQKNLVDKLQPYYDQIVALDHKIDCLKDKQREAKGLDKETDVSSNKIRLLYLQRRNLWKSINGIKKKFQYDLVEKLLEKDYIYYAFEQLNIKNMMTYRKLKKDYNTRRLRKSIAHSSWNQIQQKMRYKCVLNDKIFIQVPSEYTSRTCSKCGYISEKNRQTQSEFKCIKCGYETNADYNASRNIRQSSKEILSKLLVTPKLTISNPVVLVS